MNKYSGGSDPTVRGLPGCTCWEGASPPPATCIAGTWPSMFSIVGEALMRTMSSVGAFVAEVLPRIVVEGEPLVGFTSRPSSPCCSPSASCPSPEERPSTFMAAIGGGGTSWRGSWSGGWRPRIHPVMPLAQSLKTSHAPPWTVSLAG